MLVLTRKRREAIVLTLDGREITVSVAQIRGNAVRIGIDAPRECNVRRRELAPEEDTIDEHSS